MANYYDVEVRFTTIVGAECTEHIKFFSKYAARYMAKRYYECADVQAVTVIDAITGELIYCHDITYEYDAEG